MAPNNDFICSSYINDSFTLFRSNFLWYFKLVSCVCLKNGHIWCITNPELKNHDIKANTL